LILRRLCSLCDGVAENGHPKATTSKLNAISYRGVYQKTLTRPDPWNREP
jgi:hypothetical protein